MAEGIAVNKPMDNACFDIMTQAEKKADFLYSAVDRYIDDAQAANRPELVNMWNTIRQDEQKHLQMLKEALAKDVREGRLR